MKIEDTVIRSATIFNANRPHSLYLVYSLEHQASAACSTSITVKILRPIVVRRFSETEVGLKSTTTSTTRNTSSNANSSANLDTSLKPY